MRVTHVPRLILVAVLLAASVLLCALGCGGKSAGPADTGAMEFYRNPEFAEGYRNPVDYLAYPQHPFLAPNGSSNMHCDAYMSDSYEASGPLGLTPHVIRCAEITEEDLRSFLVGGEPSPFVFDQPPPGASPAAPARPAEPPRIEQIRPPSTPPPDRPPGR